MPLFAYFASVGAVLMGLLFVAEAQLGLPKPLGLSTAFYGLPPPFKAPPYSAPQPAHETSSSGMPEALADAPIMAQAIAPGRPKTAERRTEKPRLAARRGDGRDRLAHAPQRAFGALP